MQRLAAGNQLAILRTRDLNPAASGPPAKTAGTKRHIKAETIDLNSARPSAKVPKTEPGLRAAGGASAEPELIDLT